jgi:hypothetical protein
LSGYTEDEKNSIAKYHLIPKLKKEHGLRQDLFFEISLLLKSQPAFVQLFTVLKMWIVVFLGVRLHGKVDATRSQTLVTV